LSWCARYESANAGHDDLRETIAPMQKGRSVSAAASFCLSIVSVGLDPTSGLSLD
jgi:hypothetical protein